MTELDRSVPEEDIYRERYENLRDMAFELWEGRLHLDVLAEDLQLVKAGDNIVVVNADNSSDFLGGVSFTLLRPKTDREVSTVEGAAYLSIRHLFTKDERVVAENLTESSLSAFEEAMTRLLEDHEPKEQEVAEA